MKRRDEEEMDILPKVMGKEEEADPETGNLGATRCNAGI